MSTEKLYASEGWRFSYIDRGSKLLCEAGHVICDVLWNVTLGTENWSEAFGNFEEHGNKRPMVGESMEQRCQCGRLWFDHMGPIAIIKPDGSRQASECEGGMPDAKPHFDLVHLVDIMDQWVRSENSFHDSIRASADEKAALAVLFGIIDARIEKIVERRIELHESAIHLEL